MEKIGRILVLLFIVSGTIAAKPNITKTKRYPYLIYLPENFKHNSKVYEWPLIIYLHGRSACGNNLSKVRRYGLPFFADHGMQLDAIAVAPQCPAGKNWSMENWLEPLLKELEEKYNIDKNRIYLTGMSLGGFGTWDLAIKYPGKFAAIAPLCGGGKPQNVCALKDVPVWAFHGDRDEQVPFARTQEMVEALRKCGGTPVFTILKGFPHDIHRVFADENLYKWLLQFNLTTRENDVATIISKDTIVRELPPVTKYHGSTARIGDAKELPKVAEKPIKNETVVNSVHKTEKDSKKETVAVKPVKQKIVKSAEQTDTIKGKEFMVVF